MWEVVIGLEVHAQLLCKSKIFSNASTAFGGAPNAQVSIVDLALPGVLPVLNKEAVRCAIRFGLAIGANIAEKSVFARKNYFYPDLPKGYQISQFEHPVVEGGMIPITVENKSKNIRLTRAHLEEDAGKSVHEGLNHFTGIDLNRAGTPLLEIVSEPDMASSTEAVAYAKALHALVRWIGICDGNMQEGSLRFDANVSVRKTGESLGTRREIKNLNSFKSLKDAIDYEVHWQINEIEEGRKIEQATVLFDVEKNQTRTMRTKENAHDYRYFPDPDLLPLEISKEWIENERQHLPELPEHKKTRYQESLGLSPYDANILTADIAIARYFEAVLKVSGEQYAKPVANWVMGDVSAYLKKEELSFEECKVSPQNLATLILRVQEKVVSNTLAKKIFEKLWNDAKLTVDEIIQKEGLTQITDSKAMDEIILRVLKENPENVAEFKAGKEKALNALVGKMMKLTQGKANPQWVNQRLKELLK